MLIIGRRTLPGSTAGLGPVAQRLIADAPCGVLLVPNAPRPWTQRILVAFDGSRAAQAAVELAVQLAKPLRLPLALVSITDPHGKLPQAIADEAELALAGARLEGVDAELLTRTGRIAESILAVAADTSADLIVLYRHTRGSLGRTLLGSVSDQILQRSEIPVLLCGGVAQRVGSETG